MAMMQISASFHPRDGHPWELFQKSYLYFMPWACGRPLAGVHQSHVDTCGQRGGGKTLNFLVDVVSGLPVSLDVSFVSKNLLHYRASFPLLLMFSSLLVQILSTFFGEVHGLL